MSVISKETWDNMSNKEKEEILRHYRAVKAIDNIEYITIYETLFGKENLQPKIRTWIDVLNQTDIHDFVINHPDCDNKLKLKLEAIYKISKLIELGYGGMVTEKEWKDDTVRKECIVPCDVIDGLKLTTHYYPSDKRFIAFHTKEQAEEFVYYSENEQLIQQYYMI